MDRAAAAYGNARAEAEQHSVVGERAIAQTHRAFALAFTDPDVADDELDLAHQLLTGLVLRGTTLTAQIAALVRDAGSDADIEERAQVLRTEISVAGLTNAQPALELAVCFHHAVRGAHDQLTAAISRLRQLTRSGDYAYYAEIARFMGDLPLPEPGSQARWLDGEQPTRNRWRGLVTARRGHLNTAP
ncbi:hypothetical protein ACWGCW_37715 [Streptomyces sp. NPDC054933]